MSVAINYSSSEVLTDLAAVPVAALESVPDDPLGICRAGLAEVETLPWDEWVRMAESHQGRTGPDYDQLIDDVASMCAFGDPSAISALYTSNELRVPDDLLH